MQQAADLIPAEQAQRLSDLFRERHAEAVLSSAVFAKNFPRVDLTALPTVTMAVQFFNNFEMKLRRALNDLESLDDLETHGQLQQKFAMSGHHSSKWKDLTEKGFAQLIQAVAKDLRAPFSVEDFTCADKALQAARVAALSSQLDDTTTVAALKEHGRKFVVLAAVYQRLRGDGFTHYDLTS